MIHGVMHDDHFRSWHAYNVCFVYNITKGIKELDAKTSMSYWGTLKHYIASGNTTRRIKTLQTNRCMHAVTVNIQKTRIL